MNINPLAGKPAIPSMLVNVPRMVTAYFAERPDAQLPAERVKFGTSGHRGSAFKRSFNEHHILAITQAICEYRAEQNIDGPLFLGMDTHALSEPAFATALEVLAANDVTVLVDSNSGYTPTPALSHAILNYNRGRTTGLADGIIATPSHNPPDDGGYKYNPPNAGPADTTATKWMEDRANQLLAEGLSGVQRIPFARALARGSRPFDFLGNYVNELGDVLDMEAIRASGLKLGADALGGAGIRYWGRIADQYGLNMTVLDDVADPQFRFMSVDWDGKIRMDCSSPYAMAGLVSLRDRFDVAFASDTDHDRHGIVTPSAGLLKPNQYLAVAIDYLFRNRKDWPTSAGVGKTVVSSSMIDRVAARLRRRLVEVPVGFKWFVDGLLSGALGFGGEESAGASFLRCNGTPWTTDKDGILLGLLTAEMTAKTGRDPGELYGDLARDLGDPVYERIDSPADEELRTALANMTPDQVKADEMAGEKIVAKLTHAPNGASIGGLKVITENGWFAARPSGTEDVCKIYAESFLGLDHLARIQQDAQALMERVRQ